MKDPMTEQNFIIDKGIVGVAIMIFFALIILSATSAPILDSKEDPFVIKKIKASAVYNQKAKYYGRTQKSGLFSPKVIILDKNAFNVGDTIFIK